MGVNNSWRPSVTMDDWMRDIEKRLMHEERRAGVRPAYDIVGPGIATYARPVRDWNSDGPIVNGFFYSAHDEVVNSPDDAKNWMGTVQANPFGQGLQRAWEYIDTIDAPVPNAIVFSRAFVTNEDGSRNYTLWSGPGGPWLRPDDEGGLTWGVGWTDYDELAFELVTFRIEGTARKVRGTATRTTGSDPIMFTLPEGSWPNLSTIRVARVGNSVGALLIGDDGVVQLDFGTYANNLPVAFEFLFDTDQP